MTTIDPTSDTIGAAGDAAAGDGKIDVVVGDLVAEGLGDVIAILRALVTYKVRR